MKPASILIASIIFSRFFSIIEAESLAESRWNILERDDAYTFALDIAGSKSEIEFIYSPQNGSFLHGVYLDESSQQLSAAPGQTIWGAHPEKINELQATGEALHTSLENIFIETMKGIGFEILIPSLLVDPTSGKWTPQDFRSYLLHGNYKKNSRLTYDSFYKVMQSAVAASRLSLIPKPLRLTLQISNLWSQSLWLNSTQWAQSLDFIEPLASQYSHDSHGFDAFVLFPLTQLNLVGAETIMAAIESFNSRPLQFPVEWFIENTGKISFDLRLLVLMLLTHNHQAEAALIRGIALKESPAQAYKLATLLSEAYQREENFWLNGPRKHEVNENAKIFPTGISFLDARQKWEINVSTDQGIPVWIPYHQRYHYYGAFVAAARIRDRWKNISPSHLRSLVRYLGRSYKIKTHGHELEQLTKMDRFYSAGVEAYLQLFR